MRYLEDFRAGEVIELGSHTFTEEEILTFARQYDPQPFHVDPERAASSIYGGLIASGWHTCSLYMRMVVDGLLADSASMGSPGLDSLRWLLPVRPGDTLRARYTALEVTPSRSRPDRGVVRFRGEMINQRDEVAMSLEGVGFFGRRDAPTT
jgi:acyl dehydratase